jgi:hypothetical protein
MSIVPLPFSDKTHVGVLDENGHERIETVADLRARFGVDALIRLQKHDFDQLGQAGTEQYFVHFNLEETLNQVGKRYAVLPIHRPGYRTHEGTEALPIMDVSRHRIGFCETVLQRVPIEMVSDEYFRNSLPSIRSVAQLRSALVDRYARMFPQLSADDLLARGCAITRLRFSK